MAATMTKRGQNDNVVTYEFVCDSLADLSKIEKKYITIGSIATVIQGETGFEVYIANSQHQWINIGSTTTNENNNNNNNNSDQNLISVYDKKMVATQITEYFQRNISISNNIITGQIYKINGGDPGLFLSIKENNYYSPTENATPLTDMNKDIYYLTIYDALTGPEEYADIWLESDDILDIYFGSDDMSNKSLYISKFTPNEFQTFLSMSGNEANEYLTSHLIEQYDLSQIEVLNHNE